MSDIARDVLVYGVGQLAELVHFYLSQDSEHTVCGFVADREFSSLEQLCGLPVLTPESALRDFGPQSYAMFVAIGYTSMNDARRTKVDWARGNGYDLVSYVSSRATIFKDLKVGHNCLILEDNTIQPFVSIGDNVVMWSGNHIGHHSVIEDDVFVTSHCVVSGNCTVGRGSFLGVNCTIQNGVRVGSRTFIGPRALVRGDTKFQSVLVDGATKPLRISSSNLKF